LFDNLNSILPIKTLVILQNSQQTVPIKNWDDQGWLRLTEYLELLKCHFELKTVKKKLETFPPRMVIE
jgi:hypothetical protein